jgi:vitamin B12 transporter
MNLKPVPRSSRDLCRLMRVAWSLGLLVIPLQDLVAEAVLELSAFPVYAGSRVEKAAPAETQLTERMRRDVRVDMQTRGGARYQSDITVRGGIFEGTGLMVGGLALFDPQTGHYAAEIPLDPGFFSGARLLTGFDNALHGFNSTAGTIDWQWAPIRVGGRADLTVGTDGLFGFQAIAGGRHESGAAWQVSGSMEEGNGSLAFGDFELERISGRVEFKVGTGKLFLFGGHVSKFAGWPGLYTGIASLNETDETHTSLLGWQWIREGDRNLHRVGGYWRQLDDDYEFNRFSPNRFFEHLTEVWSLQGDGLLQADWANLGYRWVFVSDRIRRSTSLVNGDFSERDYAEVAVTAQRRLSTKIGELVPYIGMGLQSTNEDSTVGSPQAGARLTGSLENGAWQLYAEWSESSQVPGYTVLKSNPTGLFGGNPDLGREMAETLELGAFVQQGDFSVQTVVFRRDDEGLVDWVFSSNSPSARQAAPVDIKVHGVETWLRWEPGTTAFEFGYAWLDKDSEYDDPGVDASFYALNYARHRLLATLEHTLTENFMLRLEAEYRDHPANILRAGGDEAFKLHAQAVLEDFPAEGLRLTVRLENLTDEAFESVPGTPGQRREGRLVLSYLW